MLKHVEETPRNLKQIEKTFCNLVAPFQREQRSNFDEQMTIARWVYTGWRPLHLYDWYLQNIAYEIWWCRDTIKLSPFLFLLDISSPEENVLDILLEIFLEKCPIDSVGFIEVSFQEFFSFKK